MKLEGTIHCEGPGCEIHAHVGADTMEAGRLPVGFVKLIEYQGSRDHEMAFCGADCAMKKLAELPPPEMIHLDGEQ